MIKLSKRNPRYISNNIFILLTEPYEFEWDQIDSNLIHQMSMILDKHIYDNDHQYNTKKMLTDFPVKYILNILDKTKWIVSESYSYQFYEGLLYVCCTYLKYNPKFTERILPTLETYAVEYIEILKAHYRYKTGILDVSLKFYENCHILSAIRESVKNSPEYGYIKMQANYCDDWKDMKLVCSLYDVPFNINKLYHDNYSRSERCSRPTEWFISLSKKEGVDINEVYNIWKNNLPSLEEILLRLVN